jgi:hypothetical protein
MPQLTFGQKISWFLFQKGLGAAKPDYLLFTKTGDPLWFQVADRMIHENNIQGRNMVLDQLLRPQNFRNNPKRNQYLKLAGYFLNKGIIDERRRVIKYIDANTSFFSESDDLIMGPIITAQRDSDIITANTAEEVLFKIRGEVKHTKEDFR